MATNDPNGDDFEIKVSFTQLEKGILDSFTRQIKDAATAIQAIVGKMDQQIQALQALQIDVRKYADLSGSVGSGSGAASIDAGGGGVSGRGAGNYQMQGSVGSGGNGFSGADEIVRAIADLGEKIDIVGSGGGGPGGGYLGGGNWRTMRGQRIQPGMRPWEDPHAMFENTQFVGGQATVQDAMTMLSRNLRGNVSDETGYVTSGRNKLGQFQRVENVSAQDLQRRHQAREQGQDQGQTYQEYYDQESKLRSGPFAGVRSAEAARGQYLNSLGVEVPPNASAANMMEDLNQSLTPFRSGGIYNPTTYAPMMNKLQSNIQTASTFGRFGMQLGYAPSLDPFSSSGRSFFGAQKDAFLNSWGGLNPFLSGAQAQEINTSVAGMGYGGDVSSQIRNTLAGVTQNTGIPIGDSSAIIDKSFRWGYANLQQLATFMENDIPKAAQAARMNVSQFSDQLVQTATAMSTASAGGTMFPMAAQQIANMSEGTGVSPAMAGAMMTDPVTQWYAMSLASQATGGAFNPSAYFNSSNRAAYTLEAGSQRATQIMGGTSPAELAKITAGANAGNAADKARLQTVQNAFDISGLSGNTLPGINNLQDVLNRYSPDAIQRTKVIGGIDSYLNKDAAIGQKAYNSFKMPDHEVMKFGHPTAQGAATSAEGAYTGGYTQPGVDAMIRKLAQEQDFAKLGSGGQSSADVANALIKSHSTIADKLKALKDDETDLTKKTNSATAKNGGKLTITLDAGPTLKGLLQASTSNANYNQGGTNSIPAPSAVMGNATVNIDPSLQGP